MRDLVFSVGGSVLAPTPPKHTHPCWRCGAEPSSKPVPTGPLSLFCTYCNSLQAPAPDYFLFFGLPKKLSIDTEDLQSRFYSMSRKLHPDRYTRATETERTYSLEATSILNDGYRVLRDPVQRAEYVLKENGFDIGEQRSKDVPPELLEEVFELNEALEELRGGDDDVLPQLRGSREHFSGLLTEIDDDLGVLFLQHDESEPGEARQKVLGEIRAILNRRRYVSNLISEVDKELASRAS
jgi:molecular chaperone HscB